MTDDRGLSEALGFILIFSLIISSIGIAYVFGLQGLEDTRDVERVNNAERAFDVLADNMEDLTQRRAPSRSTEIKLADARLSAGDQVRINVTIPAHGFVRDAEVRPVVYHSGTGTKLRYVGGAVVRTQPSGSVLVRTPDYTYADNSVVVPIIQTRSSDGGIAGSTTVLIRAETSVSTVGIGFPDSDDQAWVNVTTERPDPWERYFENKAAVIDCTQVADDDRTRVECELDTSLVERIAAPIVKIDYEFAG